MSTKPKVSPIGLRIERRMQARKLTYTEVESELGVGKDHVYDVAKGKKASLKGDIISSLADILGTTEVWLLTGSGPEETNAVHAPPISISATVDVIDISDVSRSRSATILISSLDLVSGTCAGTMDGRRFTGRIFDPAHKMPGNPYIEAMSRMAPLTVVVKDLKLMSGENLIAILDFRD